MQNKFKSCALQRERERERDQNERLKDISVFFFFFFFFVFFFVFFLYIYNLKIDSNMEIIIIIILNVTPYVRFAVRVNICHQHVPAGFRTRNLLIAQRKCYPLHQRGGTEIIERSFMIYTVGIFRCKPFNSAREETLKYL